MSALMPEFKALLFEEKEPHIGVVTMNRPGQLNAINLDMLGDFERLFQACPGMIPSGFSSLRAQARGILQAPISMMR